MLDNLQRKKDALILIGISSAVLLFGNLLAWVGLAWGMWSIIRED
jgi:hypothetical protein